MEQSVILTINIFRYVDLKRHMFLKLQLYLNIESQVYSTGSYVMWGVWNHKDTRLKG